MSRNEFLFVPDLGQIQRRIVTLIKQLGKGTFADLWTDLELACITVRDHLRALCAYSQRAMAEVWDDNVAARQSK